MREHEARYMTTPEQRYEHWVDALRARNGAQDDLDRALDRYVTDDTLHGAQALRQHVAEALAYADGALAGLQRALEHDVGGL